MAFELITMPYGLARSVGVLTTLISRSSVEAARRSWSLRRKKSMPLVQTAAYVDRGRLLERVFVTSPVFGSSLPI